MPHAVARNSLEKPLIHRYATMLPWLMWGLTSLFYFFEFFLQVSPSVMVPDLMKSFQISAAQVGNLSATYFYVYAAMQIPVGILIDRFGARRLLTMAAANCAIGCTLFAYAPSIELA